jgi:hypothetical protein
MSQDQSTQHIKLPVMPLHNPLTADDEAALNYVLQRLPVVEDMLLRAMACGLDVGERGARHEMHAATAKAIKQHFFPDQLPTASE